MLEASRSRSSPAPVPEISTPVITMLPAPSAPCSVSIVMLALRRTSLPKVTVPSTKISLLRLMMPSVLAEVSTVRSRRKLSLPALSSIRPKVTFPPWPAASAVWVLMVRSKLAALA